MLRNFTSAKKTNSFKKKRKVSLIIEKNSNVL